MAAPGVCSILTAVDLGEISQSTNSEYGTTYLAKCITVSPKIL